MLTVHFMIFPKFIYSSDCCILALTDCLVQGWVQWAVVLNVFQGFLRSFLKEWEGCDPPHSRASEADVQE